MSSSQGFRESNLFGAPIRDLGLKIFGTRLEPVIDEFRAELEQTRAAVDTGLREMRKGPTRSGGHLGVEDGVER